MAAKVIVLGSVNGNFESTFKKLSTLHAKQSFSFAILTGDLFSADQDDESLSRLLSGQISLPLSTYFTTGTRPLPERVIERIGSGEDICENLIFLGKRSITKTSEGLRIVALGGALDKTIVGGQSKEQHLPFHTADDAKALRGANSADILLTACWPSNVTSGSAVSLAPEQQAAIASTDEIAELCATLKPRYHFSASPADFFYEREPFFHAPSDPDDDTKAVTRFLSIAPYGNAKKEKALYAFNIQAGEKLTTLPVGTTRIPFQARQNAKKRHADQAGHGENGRHSRRRRQRSPPPGPDRCFFCLSNANLDTHMICSIGEDAYVTTAKGPLPAPDTFASAGLTSPCHQLIIPLPHEPTTSAMGEDAVKTFQEMTRYKEALQATVATKSEYKLGAVTWEISRQSGIHLHWQFLPAPAKDLRSGLIETGFRVEAENRQYPAFEETDLGAALDSGDFFRIWLWSDDRDNGIQGKQLVMRLDESFRFDLQFGRKVMSKLLYLEDRVSWKEVAQSLPDETADAEAFKVAFKSWDFTLEG